MSSYVRSRTLSFEFDGDTVIATLGPLETLDSLSFKAAAGGEDGDVLKLLASMLPKYVKELTGLKDSAGTAITIDEVCRDAYFLPVLVRLGNELASGASLQNPTGSDKA